MVAPLLALALMREARRSALLTRLADGAMSWALRPCGRTHAEGTAERLSSDVASNGLARHRSTNPTPRQPVSSPARSHIAPMGEFPHWR